MFGVLLTSLRIGHGRSDTGKAAGRDDVAYAAQDALLAGTGCCKRYMLWTFRRSPLGFGRRAGKEGAKLVADWVGTDVGDEAEMEVIGCPLRSEFW